MNEYKPRNLWGHTIEQLAMRIIFLVALITLALDLFFWRT